MHTTMKFKISVPEKVFAEVEVTKIVAQGIDGSFCLLPNHVDFVTILPVGILSYVESDTDTEVFVAVDQGILVKKGRQVWVSVRRAASHTKLEQLEETVRETYQDLTDEERVAQRASANLEANFVRRFLELKDD